MTIRITHTTFLVLVFLTPFIAFAATRAEFQQEIANTFKQIQVLQAQLDGQDDTGAPPTTSTSSTECPAISRTLSVGSEGGDVTALQRYLAEDPDIYPEGLVTGYFGPLTQQAVQRWQAKYGIVSAGTPETTGYGLVGPKTRGALKSCGGGTSSQFSGILRVSPTSGSAPLSVVAEVSVNTAQSCERSVYTVSFGDGTQPTQIIVPNDHCRQITREITHTYTQEGNYIVVFGTGEHNSSVDITVHAPFDNSTGTTTSATSTEVSIRTSPEAIRVQMQSLFAHIQSLQAKLDSLGSGTGSVDTSSPTQTTPTTGSGSVTRGGLSLSRQLEHGSRGDDVSRLQQFLAQDSSIYPEGLVTGYYGSLTTAAVQQFQARCGIVSSGTPASTGYGRVGPSTLQALTRGCGATEDSGQVGGLLRVTPVKGAAPLVVTAAATVNTARSCSRAVYELDFGDGSAPFQLVVPDGGCKEISQNIPHTYTQAGTYTVTLSVGSHRSTVRINVGESGTATTTDSGTTSNAGSNAGSDVEDGLTAAPLSGEVPRTITFHATINASGSCDGGSYTIDFDDGETAELTYPADDCSPQAFKVTHRYDRAGDFIARLYPSAPADIDSVASVARVVLSLTQAEIDHGDFAVAAGVDGDSRKIKVEFGINGPLCTSYRLEWGEGIPAEEHDAGDEISCVPDTTVKTFEYTYSDTGSYTIRLQRARGSLADLDDADEETATIVISE